MILESILSGGALGFLGSIGTGILDYFKQKEQNKHELAMLGAQRALIEAQGANAVALENVKNFGLSYDSDKSTYAQASSMTGFLGILANLLLVLVDFLRGFTRPGMSWYLVLSSSLIGLYAFEQSGLDKVFLKGIAEQTAAGCLELSSACVLWWFGTRSIRAAGKR